MQSSTSGTKKSPRPRRAKTSAREQLSRDQILLAVEKKKRCNARAQLIVEEFIDPVTDLERFLDKLQYISQSHYDDIVDERFIELLCGYPMCSMKMVSVPKQQFYVSRASNQVYDITERKKFCSSLCFRASNFIRVQLLTSPLWMRDHETIPEFKLMEEWRNPKPTAPSDSNNPETALSITDQMQRLHVSQHPKEGDTNGTL